MNLILDTHFSYGITKMYLSYFYSKLEFLPQFHGPLNIENDSVGGAYVNHGHILLLVFFYMSNQKYHVSIMYLSPDY